MKKIPLTYLPFFIAALVVFVTTIFFEKGSLVYVKPLVFLALIYVYVRKANKYKLVYILSMLILFVNDTLVYSDFMRYFDAIAIVIALYYVFSMFLLKVFFTLKGVNLNTIFSFPVIISLVLISYLTYSITDLVLPHILDSLLFFGIIMISMISFVSMCFYVYITDKYSGNFRLFIVACCCLFVNALLPINEILYYNRVFTIVVNVAEMAGLYFFMEFLIKAKPQDLIRKEQSYF
ncbi:hypothetical protein [Aquimarina sp. MMG016]|uniref:hypothetical protein n=1 Tax=Aquimarina sp. MMG016 TaxID=2822690 RepID=UPI001B3A647B|nr:hypothetical protein [Aquimarina sp. MMG016]